MEQPPAEETDQFDQWMDDIFDENVQVPDNIFGPPPEMDDDPCTPPATTGDDGDEVEPTPSPIREDRQYLRQNEKRFDDGYDSEGHDGPYVPPYVETVDENEDTIVPTCVTAPTLVNTTATATVPTTATTNDIPNGVIVPIDDDVLKKMTNPKLRQELKL